MKSEIISGMISGYGKTKKVGREINAIANFQNFLPPSSILSTLDSSFKLIIHLEHLFFNS